MEVKLTIPDGHLILSNFGMGLNSRLVVKLGIGIRTNKKLKPNLKIRFAYRVDRDEIATFRKLKSSVKRFERDGSVRANHC